MVADMVSSALAVYFYFVLSRAEAEATRIYAAQQDKVCRCCGEILPTSFFSTTSHKCRTCLSDCNWRRHLAASPRESPPEQKCLHCLQLRLADEFTSEGLHPTGLRSWCKSCQRKEQAAFRILNAKVPLPAAALLPTKLCAARGKNSPPYIVFSSTHFLGRLQRTLPPLQQRCHRENSESPEVR